MRKGLLFIPAFLASLGVAAPASDLKQLLQRDDNDPDDVSFIKKIAAIGDSYSAGIGAGERLGRPLDPNTFGDWKCKCTVISAPNNAERDSRQSI